MPLPPSLQVLIPLLFHVVQVGLQRRIPALRGVVFDVERRVARCAGPSFSLLATQHEGGILLLACCAEPQAASWLQEMRDLVEEVRRAHMPQLHCVETPIDDPALLLPFSPPSAPPSAAERP